jgi:hypothetical protein
MTNLNFESDITTLNQFAENRPSFQEADKHPGRVSESSVAELFKLLGVFSLEPKNCFVRLAEKPDDLLDNRDNLCNM